MEPRPDPGCLPPPPDRPGHAVAVVVGDVLFMAIETATVALLLASYFYTWRNYPQDAAGRRPGWTATRRWRDPVPELLLRHPQHRAPARVVLLMAWVDLACQRQFDELERLNVSKPSRCRRANARRHGRPGCSLGLAGLVAHRGPVHRRCGSYQFPGLLVSWDDNAYASLVWTILGLHLVYIVIEAIEMAVLAGWIALYELGENQAGRRDPVGELLVLDGRGVGRDVRGGLLVPAGGVRAGRDDRQAGRQPAAVGRAARRAGRVGGATGDGLCTRLVVCERRATVPLHVASAVCLLAAVGGG